PGIVHRLDRDTSGLLVVAKTDLAHRRLGMAIERREVKRVYAALVWGHLRKSPVDIEAPIARHPKERTRMTVAQGGRHAVTHAAVVARFAHADLLRVRLGTGRTQQIRLHLARGGSPIVAGLVNVRGTLVTVVEGWRALGQAPPSASPETPVTSAAPGSTIILELARRDADNGGGGGGATRKLIGFTVDEVTDLLAGGNA